MAGQENFKAVIKAHLEQRAKTDKQFAKAYKNKAKSLDECCNYILGEAQKLAKSGQVDVLRVVFSDCAMDRIYTLAGQLSFIEK